MSLRAYAIVGWVLVALFAGRVVAQPLSLIVGGLPPFEAWQGAPLPYWLLLISQLVIVAALGWTTYRMSAAGIKPRRSLGAIALFLGGLYFAFMMGRLVLGLTLFSNVRWFASPIPTIFHLVLAGWILLYGHFHWARGATTPSNR